MLSAREQRELRKIDEWFETTEPDLAEVIRDVRSPTARNERIAAFAVPAGYMLASCPLIAGILLPSFFLIFVGVVALVGVRTTNISQRRDGPDERAD